MNGLRRDCEVRTGSSRAQQKPGTVVRAFGPGRRDAGSGPPASVSPTTESPALNGGAFSLSPSQIDHLLFSKASLNRALSNRVDRLDVIDILVGAAEGYSYERKKSASFMI